MSADSDHKQDAPRKLGTHALLAEYRDASKLIAAANKVRERGFERWDTYTPFPVHGIDAAMGIKRTKLPWIILCAATCGGLTAITFQWWTSVVDYPWIISGKPLFSIPAFIPITFELTVLFSTVTTFISTLLLNGLPNLSSPLDRVRRFARSTDDRFFLVIETADPKYDAADTLKLIESTEPDAVEAVPDDPTSDKLPPNLVYGVLIVLAFLLAPFGLFANFREMKSSKPQFQVVHNMDFQAKFKPQAENEAFADHRSTREPVKGTIAVGGLRHDTHFFEGKVGGQFVDTLPTQFVVDAAHMQRGQERFGIYCAPCHGLTGDGDGMIHRHAFALKEGTWVKPSNMTEARVAEKSVGELYDTISNGIRNMPGYARQIAPEDRWAIVLYVRALQRSQGQVAANAPATQP
jgi:mono/diheme cytochrome c family protein